VWLLSVNFSTFSAPQKYTKLLRSHLRLFLPQLHGKRGENGRRNDHFTVTDDVFQSKPWCRLKRVTFSSRFRLLYVLVECGVADHDQAPIRSRKWPFPSFKVCLASTPSIFFSSWQLWSPLRVAQQYTLSCLFRKGESDYL
jgi:hypothetical protein